MRWDAEIRIGGRTIAPTEPAYFIADIAANHDGELARARELIWRAKEPKRQEPNPLDFLIFLSRKIHNPFTHPGRFPTRRSSTPSEMGE